MSSLFEKETIVNFNEEETEASVYTFNKALQNRLRKLSEERPEECRIDPDERLTRGGAAAFLVPKRWVTVRPPRSYTPEQLELRRERMQSVRAAKINNVV